MLDDFGGRRNLRRAQSKRPAHRGEREARYGRILLDIGEQGTRLGGLKRLAETLVRCGNAIEKLVGLGLDPVFHEQELVAECLLDGRPMRRDHCDGVDQPIDHFGRQRARLR